MKQLTPKQEWFIREYLRDLNATQAAIRAGYSRRTARSIAQENLTKPDIQEAIQEAMVMREKRTEVTQDYVIEKLIEDIEDQNNKYTTIRTKSLELLGRHLGMFKGSMIETTTHDIVLDNAQATLIIRTLQEIHGLPDDIC